MNGNCFKFCLKMGKVKTIFVKTFNRPITSNVILMISWDLALTSKRNPVERQFRQDPIQGGSFIEVTLGTEWRGGRDQRQRSQLGNSGRGLGEVTRAPNKKEERTYSRRIRSGHVWELMASGRQKPSV